MADIPPELLARIEAFLRDALWPYLEEHGFADELPGPEALAVTDETVGVLRERISVTLPRELIGGFLGELIFAPPQPTTWRLGKELLVQGFWALPGLPHRRPGPKPQIPDRLAICLYIERQVRIAELDVRDAIEQAASIFFKSQRTIEYWYLGQKGEAALERKLAGAFIDLMVHIDDQQALIDETARRHFIDSEEEYPR